MKLIETIVDKWNPRYVQYALAHRKTPEQMIEADKERWPGGHMAGFMIWISQRKSEFYEAHPEAFLDRYRISDHKAWDDWIRQRAVELVVAHG
jgi:hypothetical protein